LCDLHHIFHFQRIPLGKGLRDKLRPTRQLRAGTNERFARSDDANLSPHRPAQRTPQFFRVVQRAVVFVRQGRFMSSDGRHFMTVGIGDRRSCSPGAEDQPFQ